MKQRPLKVLPVGKTMATGRRKGAGTSSQETSAANLSDDPPDLVRADSHGGAQAKMNDIGRRLKEARRAKGMTLAQLAERTGLSVGTLSQSERGLVSPTVRTIYTVSTALEISPAWVIDPNGAGLHDPDGPYITRRSRRKEILRANGVVKEIITPATLRAYKGYFVEVAPGGSSGENPYSHFGEEIGYVISGLLTIEIDGVRSILQSGDCFAFPSALEHRFRNEGKVATTVLWINSHA
jgi:transcriptional regulator with XRE-family HTH domain